MAGYNLQAVTLIWPSISWHYQLCTKLEEYEGTMRMSQLQDAKENLGIGEWGAGYFTIDKNGHVVCTPNGIRQGVSLHKITEAARKHGLSTPIIIRFPQLIKGQLEKMDSAFRMAMAEFGYKGSYGGVFPFKVNQRKEFIDAIVSCGLDMDWGLEVGSKPEFMAALSYRISERALLVCNGFKDDEFIDMAFLAASLGRKVVLVIEGPDELQKIVKKMKTSKISACANLEIGLRIRLYTRGSGHWQNSSE